MTMTVKQRLQRIADDVPAEVEAPPALERQIARLERSVEQLLGSRPLRPRVRGRARSIIQAPDAPGARAEADKLTFADLDPDDEDIQRRLVRLLAQAHEGWDAQIARLLEMEGGALTADEVAARLGVSADEVRARTERQRLLAVERPDGTMAYPAWQLTETGPLPGIETVLAAHRFLGPEVAVWFLSPDPQLGDRRPLDVLREGGQVRAVARAAASYGEQGAP